MRYFLECAYHGHPFSGWQRQPNAPSVQQTLEAALTRILRQPVFITGSGRTDAGVHARQQFAHFDLPTPLDGIEILIFKLNNFLPPDIAIRRIFPVADDLHARFSALSRRYEYHLSRTKDPFSQRLSYFFNRPLDVAAMNEAAGMLVGYDDFQSFSLVKTDVNHFYCHLEEARWEERGERLIFHVKADRFLRGMVRALVGTLLDVGLGRLDGAGFERVIQARDRRQAGRAVPPDGLFLVEVAYPTGSW
jgi:tRNA pseudouridine38-40 synthase